MIDSLSIAVHAFVCRGKTTSDFCLNFHAAKDYTTGRYVQQIENVDEAIKFLKNHRINMRVVQKLQNITQEESLLNIYNGATH